MWTQRTILCIYKGHRETEIFSEVPIFLRASSCKDNPQGKIIKILVKKKNNNHCLQPIFWGKKVWYSATLNHIAVSQPPRFTHKSRSTCGLFTSSWQGCFKSGSHLHRETQIFTLFWCEITARVMGLGNESRGSRNCQQLRGLHG